MDSIIDDAIDEAEAEQEESAPAETASFVLIFTIIYVAGTRYLRDQAQTDPPDAERADAPDDAATADSETAGESGPTDAAE